MADGVEIQELLSDKGLELKEGVSVQEYHLSRGNHRERVLNVLVNGSIVYGAHRDSAVFDYLQVNNYVQPVSKALRFKCEIDDKEMESAYYDVVEEVHILDSSEVFNFDIEEPVNGEDIINFIERIDQETADRLEITEHINGIMDKMEGIVVTTQEWRVPIEVDSGELVINIVIEDKAILNPTQVVSHVNKILGARIPVDTNRVELVCTENLDIDF